MKKTLKIFVLMAASVFAIIGIEHIYTRFSQVRADDRSWTQTDWQGGVSSQVITSDATTFSYEDSIDYSQAGKITLEKRSGWHLDDWNYRRKITFDNTQTKLGVTPEALVNFPFLVKLENGVNIDYSKTNNDGSDIRFIDSDGTALSYEIEEWNESGASYVWVKIPQIDEGNTDHVFVYYGNPTATDASESANVWNSDFLAVWHLKEPSGNVLDSTSNGRHGTAVNLTRASSGIVGKSILTAASNSYVDVTMPLGATVTIESWGKSTATTFSDMLWCIDSDNHGPDLFFSGATIYLNTWDGAGNPYCARPTTSNQWHLYTAVISSSITRLYVDNVLCGTANYRNPTGSDFHISSSAGYDWEGYIDEVRISSVARTQAWVIANYLSQINNFASYDNEAFKYPDSGTLISNVFDVGYPADWGNITYTKSGTGDVKIKVRTDQNPEMNGAPEWNSCDLIETGTDLSENNCVNQEDRYIQYYANLNSSAPNIPSLDEIVLSFSASDQTAPITNAHSVYLGNSVEDGEWINFEPTIIWTEGDDNEGGNGILGYCIALDEVDPEASSTLLNPAISGGKLTGLNDGIDNASCPFIAIGESINLDQISGLNLTSNKKYYFSIKAVDLAGNIFNGESATYQDLISFKYDSTRPQNVLYISTPSLDFGSISDMFFNWPVTGTSRAKDNESGILGWQYAINSSEESDWKGTSHHGRLNLDYIPYSEEAGEFYLTVEENGEDVIIGNNTIYFRSIDIAGNVSIFATGGINYGGAAPEFPAESVVTISPQTSTSNSFSLGWPEALPRDGDEIKSYYYMINTEPPTTLSTLEDNNNIYIPTDLTEISTRRLIGAVKGVNNVYVVAVDDKDNYSPTKAIHGTFNLNSSLPDAPLNVAVADLSIKNNELWRVAITWNEPAYKGNGDLTYIISRSSNGSNWTQIASTTGLSYTDITPNSSLFYYKVATVDSSRESIASPSESASVSITPQGRYDTPAELVALPSVSDIKTRYAKISWVTDRICDSKVQLGLESGSYFQDEMYRSDMVTNHEIELTNLQPGTIYYFRVKWTDADGNTGVSKESTFQTNQAPLVEDIIVDTVGLNYAILKLTTSGATKAEVFYGKTKSYGGSKEINTASTSSEYSIMLTELEDGTEYHYKIVLTDEEGYKYESFEDHLFSTPPRPKISDVQIQEKKGVPSPTVEVFWETNIATNSIVRYTKEGSTLDKVDMELVKGAHTMEVSNLYANTNYQLVVEGVDSFGNRAISDPYLFTTATDTRPPKISNIKSYGDTQSADVQTDRSRSGQLVISWDTDEPSSSQVMYSEGASGDNYSYSTQTDGEMRQKHVIIVANLAPSKVYHFKVLSKDEAGNLGESKSVTAITPKSSDSVMESITGSLGKIFGFL